MKKIIIVSLILLVVFGAGLATYFIVREFKKNEPGIYVSAYPHKLTYYVGEELDLSGLIVYEVRKYEKERIINNNDLIIHGFDSSKQAISQKVIVSYKSFSSNFFVSIIPFPDPLLQVVGISVELLYNKDNIFQVGSSIASIVSRHCLIVHYSDKTTKTLNVLPAYIVNSAEYKNTLENEFDFYVVYIDPDTGKSFNTTFTIQLID